MSRFPPRLKLFLHLCVNGVGVRDMGLHCLCTATGAADVPTECFCGLSESLPKDAALPVYRMGLLL